MNTALRALIEQGQECFGKWQAAKKVVEDDDHDRGDLEDEEDEAYEEFRLWQMHNAEAILSALRDAARVEEVLTEFAVATTACSYCRATETGYFVCKRHKVGMDTLAAVLASVRPHPQPTSKGD